MTDYTKEIPERYRIDFNRLQGVFYIMDMWHEAVKNLPDDGVIPDNSPAVKAINALEVNALLGLLKEMGWLDKIVNTNTGTSDNVIPGASSSVKTLKTVYELAIEHITSIVQADKDTGVAKEAVLAIRDIINKL